jgi:hypothetical protein
MITLTICCTYFKSLGLANLDAALYSVRQQDLSRVHELVLVDNDTADRQQAILDRVAAHAFPMPARVYSFKHGDPMRTHSWSSNVAVRASATPWILMTRADYLLDREFLRRCVAVAADKPDDWDGFVTSNGCHLAADIAHCEAADWRRCGPGVMRGTHFDYTATDAGVWMARRSAFDRVGGLDESLTAWGHAQTDFQYRLHATGTEFVRIPQTMFWHPWHAAPRDLALAHAQLRAKGIEPRTLWARHEGGSPY